MTNKKISVSLLSADFTNLERDITMVEQAGAHMLHIDVMDGHFVPNITIGPPVVAAIKNVSSIPLDVHLMIENPEHYVYEFIKSGADYLTVHAEASHHLHRVLQQIKSQGVKAGVSLNPHTPLCMIENVLNDLDLVLIMSVNPGFGGQRFIQESLEKAKKLKKMLTERNLHHVAIEIDGGVKLENIKEVLEAGVDFFVSGSGIFKTDNPAKTIKEMIHAISK